MTTATRRRTRRIIERGHTFHTEPLEVPGIGQRRLHVYLPPGYERDTQRAYPVAYMFDGQNVFGDEGSFAGGWRMHRVLDGLRARGLQVPIVVGIHHGGPERILELTPWHTSSGQEGRANALLDWIAGDLAGQVRSKLRALSGPAHTLVGGSSMGGLTALYAVFRRPDFFGGALAMSPSLWVSGGAIFRYLSVQPLPWRCRVYMDAGGRERWLQNSGAQLANLLARRGLEPGQHLMWRADPRGGHHERSWRRRLPAALRFLLRP